MTNSPLLSRWILYLLIAMLANQASAVDESTPVYIYRVIITLTGQKVQTNPEFGNAGDVITTAESLQGTLSWTGFVEPSVDTTTGPNTVTPTSTLFQDDTSYTPTTSSVAGASDTQIITSITLVNTPTTSTGLVTSISASTTPNTATITDFLVLVTKTLVGFSVGYTTACYSQLVMFNVPLKRDQIVITSTINLAPVTVTVIDCPEEGATTLTQVTTHTTHENPLYSQSASWTVICVGTSYTSEFTRVYTYPATPTLVESIATSTEALTTATSAEATTYYGLTTVLVTATTTVTTTPRKDISVTAYSTPVAAVITNSSYSFSTPSVIAWEGGADNLSLLGKQKRRWSMLIFLLSLVM
ncbi:hypothetical protein BABINDRAFT_167425 [Babjeviella inositovora NRRL Y-12698]|uniref:Uncharacterized protein n=1 Tax=Babjeviella inositovora NRRL Y-12698 TaxID=984486 RepID=A0A1E3QPK6_9ASCO|nr:uncharacterized protein BABINDRAFT_167425 [Babjeviella inositovora NRRL Y-12698]ODQ79580.1 hypothetical protein BABINDRAFT_167425 [Babjeviella inositovora NRRL Y-12698]